MSRRTDVEKGAPRPTDTSGRPSPHSPSGLMVLSEDSLSLELPLDMRAAMEKALAREESCGLGGGVYSMATHRRSGWARGGRDGVSGAAEPGYRAEGKRSAPSAARSPALTRGRGDPIGRRPIGSGTRQGPRPGRGGGRRRAEEEEENKEEEEEWRAVPAGGEGRG